MAENEMEHNGLERSIGRLEGKLDLVISTVSELSSSFRNLEAGRLSRLELSFNTVKTELSVKARWDAILSATIASVIGSIFTGVVLYFLLHKPA